MIGKYFTTGQTTYHVTGFKGGLAVCDTVTIPQNEFHSAIIRRSTHINPRILVDEITVEQWQKRITAATKVFMAAVEVL
jgi:hypothetical protein